MERIMWRATAWNIMIISIKYYGENEIDIMW